MNQIEADTEYIHRVLGGDTSAFQSLVERHQDMVYSIAFKIVGNKEDAEDVAQEVFVKCYRFLKSYNFQSRFSTWLYRIAYNHAIDYYKKLRNKKHTRGPDDFCMDIEVKPENTSEKLDQKVLQSLVKNAINMLPADDKIIVLLYYYNDYPLKEIAEIAGIKENHVKIKLHRARAKLMQQLEKSREVISSIISIS